MKEEQKNKERHWISFRVQPGEYRQIHSLYKQTNCKTLSDYAKKVLMNKPVIISYRNESEQEILSATMSLVKDANGIGNNFNQAVKRLHTLDGIPQFKTWYLLMESERQILLHKIEEIRKLTYKIHARWSQE